MENGESENLFTFLESIELQQYYNAIKNELKIDTVQQLKLVQEMELEDIRMKKPDIQKLRKSVRKEYPQSALGKLKKRLSRSSSESQSLRTSRTSVAGMPIESPTTPPPVAVGRRIIPRDCISIQKDIGQGEFGVVKHAVYTNDLQQKVEVAAKCLSQSQFGHGMTDFLKEASSMQSVTHCNIVVFYGLVFEEDKEIMLITEYAPLRSLLECLHNSTLRSILTITKLCSFSTQIATGMTYLETQGLIHRDLACRNILVFSHTKVKIGDFGLSRALGLGKEYYQTKYSADLKIPIAWSAPECISLLRFSSASDIWSFGVVMWEMFTYGEKPWDGLTSLEMSKEEIHDKIYEMINVPKSGRLKQPRLCPVEHYSLMLKCWSHSPDDRPKFTEVLTELKSIKPAVMKAKMLSLSDPLSTLNYNQGDQITVIDKKSTDAPSWQYWFAVKDDGMSGFINPDKFDVVSGDASPSLQPKKSHPKSPITTLLRTVKKSSNSHGSPKNRRRFTADMISQPQNDLKHTGHIGFDGVKFGVVPEVSESSKTSITNSTTVSNGGGSIHNGSSHTVSNGRDHWTPTIIREESKPDDSIHVDELDDFQMPDLGFSSSDFSTSFIDDMMKGLSTTCTTNTTENNNPHSHHTNLHSSEVHAHSSNNDKLTVQSQSGFSRTSQSNHSDQKSSKRKPNLTDDGDDLEAV